MKRFFIDAIRHRRSYYHLDSTPTTSDDALVALIDELLETMPTPFNSQSTRLVLLLRGQHLAFWDIVEATLKAKVPEAQFPVTQQKLHRSFRGGYGTILFYEDSKKIEDLRRAAPLYAEKFETWAEHSSAMMQFAVWTALEDMGYGASLQHYNPIIDKAVAQRWLIDPNWRLIAQMPFGTPLDTPAPRKATSTPHSRRLVFDDEL